MRRILALVCIFILLLFTGIPMFTSNLLCNETRVYADTPQISDNEKIRAAITVYLNSKGAYLSSQGIQMDAVMSLMQAQIDDFIATGVYVGGTLYDTAALILDIGLTTSPLTVILKAGAVSFFNQYLQWLIDEGKITNNQTNNNLYNGYTSNGYIYYVIGDNKPSSYAFYSSSNVTQGTSVNGWYGGTILSKYLLTYPSANMSELVSQSLGDVAITVNYASDITRTYNIKRYSSNNDSFKYPNISINLAVSGTGDDTAKYNWGIMYASRDHKIMGGPCYFLTQYNNVNTFNYGFVSKDIDLNKYYFYKVGTINSSGASPANINFNKDDFDATPTAPPSSSDGLTYQPQQTGTGNTYNTYNDYYQDWHEGDTYIYYPSDGGGGDDPGGGGDDPGGGGDEPTPGGTTPPWDGTQNPGTPAGTLTPGSDGYYFNLPDIGLPDLNIDWSINGLKEKFPFSIPWDLMAFFAVMNAEPETPYIKADIPLGIWEWNIDWDLHAFDNVARILRNMELIGFCIGLILITRSIIKG